MRKYFSFRNRNNNFFCCVVFSVLILLTSTPALIEPSHLTTNDFVVNENGISCPKISAGSSNFPASVYKYSTVASSPILRISLFIKLMSISFAASSYTAVVSESLSTSPSSSRISSLYFFDVFVYTLMLIARMIPSITIVKITHFMILLFVFYSKKLFDYSCFSFYVFLLFHPIRRGQFWSPPPLNSVTFTLLFVFISFDGNALLRI